MSKVISVKDDIVFIGLDDGTITEVKKEDCDSFTPEVGLEVEVYKSESKTIVTSKDIVYKEEPPKKKVVSKLAYCLWCVLLGAVGAHKFYAGKIWQGVLYLLFCWTYIPAIISFIEFIIVLFKKADKNGKILI